MKRGRKTLLTAAMRERIVQMLERGHTVKTTVAANGISERCYFDHCTKDPAFLAATQRARAQGRMQLVDSILKARDWRAKAWYLERTDAAQFARTEPRTVIIDQPPPTPSPEPETPPKGMQRWFTPNGEGIPLDRESLDYLYSLRRHLDPPPLPPSEKGEREAS